MSFFSDLIALGLAQIKDSAGESIRYYRGDDFIDITAVPGDGQRRGQQNDIARINGQRDWMILVSDLNFGAGSTQPRRGDQIVHAGITAEVLPQDGDDVYRMAGFAQYRVHSQVIANG